LAQLSRGPIANSGMMHNLRFAPHGFEPENPGLLRERRTEAKTPTTTSRPVAALHHREEPDIQGK